MNGCDKTDCPYCVTHDEDRIEFCGFYDCACWYVRKCQYYNEYLKEKKVINDRNKKRQKDIYRI